MEPLSPDAALAVLGDILASDASQVAVLPGRGRSKAREAQPAALAAAGSLASELGALAPARRRGALVAHIREQTGKVLGLPAADLGVQQGLRELGMDSLMAVELRNRLQATVGQALPATVAFDHPTIEALASFLATEVAALGIESTPVAKSPGAPAPTPLAAEIGRMSDEEAEAELLKELDALAPDADRYRR